MPAKLQTFRRLAASLLSGAFVMQASLSLAADKLEVADTRQPASGLFYVALDKGFFAKEQLEVNVQEIDAGGKALAAVVEGKADVALVSEMPFLFSLVKGNPVRMIAHFETSGHEAALMARRDKGIAAIADLKGKTIGYIPHTGSAVFLDLLLKANGLSDQVKLVAHKPDMVGEALIKGEIDAFAGWNLLRLPVIEKLGSQGVILDQHGLYVHCWGINVSEAGLVEKGPAFEKFLKALIKAEKWTAKNPKGAQAIIAKRLGLKSSQMASIWKNYDFSVGLHKTVQTSLVAAAGSQKLDVPGRLMPDFFNALYPSILGGIEVKRVTVFD